MKNTVGIITSVLVATGTIAFAQQSATSAKDRPGTQSETQANAEKPITVVSTCVAAKGTVTDVSRLKRSITIKRDDGTTVTIKVGKEVPNFEQIKKGDEVSVNYHESTAVALRKAAGPPSASVGEAVIVAGEGDKPAAIKVETIESSAVIEDIDYNKRRITLRAPDGMVRTMKVGEEVKNLRDMKKGDQVTVRSTEALAIEVAQKQQ
jgi:hypothetical protein